MKPAEYWPYIAAGSHIVHICHKAEKTLCGHEATVGTNVYYSTSWFVNPVTCETCVLWKLVEQMT